MLKRRMFLWEVPAEGRAHCLGVAVTAKEVLCPRQEEGIHSQCLRPIWDSPGMHSEQGGLDERALLLDELVVRCTLARQNGADSS